MQSYNSENCSQTIMGIVDIMKAQNILPNHRLVCPESHRLLTGGSPVVVIVRKPRSRQPVQRVIVCAEAL
jgi:hypothetical protein